MSEFSKDAQDCFDKYVKVKDNGKTVEIWPGEDGSFITDEQLRHLQELPEFETLDFLESGDDHVTDQGMSYIANIKSLKKIIFCAAQFSNKGFQALTKLDKLEAMCLGGNVVDTDKCLEHLPKFPNLTELNLACSNVTDKGMRYLRDINKLKKLEIEYTDVTTNGLKSLGDNLSQLESLDLCDSKANNDETLELISRNCEKLKSINIDFRDITSKGLAHLKNISGLQDIPGIEYYRPMQKDEQIVDEIQVHLAENRRKPLWQIIDNVCGKSQAIAEISIDQLKQIEHEFSPDSALKRKHNIQEHHLVLLGHMPPRQEFVDNTLQQQGSQKNRLDIARRIMYHAVLSDYDVISATNLLKDIYHDLKPGIDNETVATLVEEDKKAILNAHASARMGSLDGSRFTSRLKAEKDVSAGEGKELY